MRPLLLLIFYFFCSIIFAQTGSIRGFVYDKETGEPVIYCNTYLEGTNLGSPTDLNGLYNISKVPNGNYKIVISYIGYDTLKANIQITENKILNKNFEISQSSVRLDELIISAERQEMKTEVKAAAIKVSKKDLEMIPTIGGEPDIAQYMQIIPGVVFTGDQGGQLYIRGGSPVQNKVLLDGMIIYSPFHSIGLFSVFDSDIIKSTDVYTGGFNAEYGGRISSIMDINTIDGNKKNLSGKVSANTFGSKIFLEGPVTKGKSSFIVSAKNSYLDKTSNYIYKDPILFFDDKGLPYSYFDLYGKLTFTSDNGSKINLFGFNFIDEVDYNNISKLNWNSSGIGSKFILIPGSSPVLIEGNFAYSSYNIFLDENSLPTRESKINGFNMGFDFTSFLKNGKVKYGFDINGFQTDFTTFNSVNSQIDQDENTSEFSSYVNYQYNSTRFIIEPGFRIQKYTLGFSPEPRLGVKYIISDKLRSKFATGLYSQNIISTVSDRDVVNLFTGIISSPEELPPNSDGENYSDKFQKSIHYIAGIEYDLNQKIDFQVEGYYKDFNQLTNINRDRTSNDDNQFIVEKGSAKGIDFLTKYKSKELYVWLVYSYSIVERQDGDFTYFPHFDRRHNINFVTSVHLDKKRTWKADIRWNLGSGFPFTQTQGFYENIPFDDGINTDITQINGELEIAYSELNKGRLPYYHRLDFSLSKKFKLFKSSDLDVTFSVTNMYNRENIFYFNRVKYERINQLPLMPSLGVSLIF